MYIRHLFLQEPSQELALPSTSAPSRRLRIATVPTTVEIQTCPAGQGGCKYGFFVMVIAGFIYLFYKYRVYVIIGCIVRALIKFRVITCRVCSYRV